MKRFALFLTLLLCTFAARAAAQTEPQAAPTPDPLIYSDPAMTYTAPTEAAPVMRGSIPLEELNDDPRTVAMWVVHGGKEDARTIEISMESYTGSTEQWEGEFEVQTHNNTGQGSLIRNKTPMTLLNGMPAYYVEVAYGSGFDAKKIYVVLWADGQRGVALSETTRVGDGSQAEAREFLKQVTAVQYPLGQP